jgi:hypothetical protein
MKSTKNYEVVFEPKKNSKVDIRNDIELNEIAKILKEKQIWNSRVSKKLTNIKPTRQARHFANILIEQQSKIHQLQDVAFKNQIDLNADFVHALNNVEKCDIKSLRKKITEKIEFIKYKQKCYDALSLIPLPQAILSFIKNSKDKIELDKSLYPVPYQILKKCKLVKSPKEIGMTTKSSMRVISTNMKNQ